MTFPKRQHWVPRFYLRHFAARCGKGDAVWVFNRKSGDPFLTNVANIAVEHHLYSPLLKDGTRDHQLERRMAVLEHLLSRFWPRLANDFVDLGSEGVRKGLALFMAIQFLRHPEMRDTMTRTRARLIELLKQSEVNGGSIQIGSRIISMSPEEATAALDSSMDPIDIAWTTLIQTDAVHYASLLMRKRWSVVFIEQPHFVTSDYPLYVADQDLSRSQVAGRHAKIIFPISPTRLLLLDDLQEPANQYYPLHSDAADMYNTLTWVNTDGFMISPRPIDDVLLGMERARLEIESEIASDTRRIYRLD